MGRVRSHIVINLRADHFSAVEAEIDRQGVSVLTTLAARRPDGVAVDDPVALGQWIRGELRGDGVKCRSAIFALDRTEVVMKRLLFDAAGDLEGDLPGIVRLQMMRQLTFPPDDAAVDYIPLESEEDGFGHRVLAVAIPGERLRFLMAVARSAGLRVARIGLKSTGVASLVADQVASEEGAVLGVAMGSGLTEFVVVEGREIVFSRAAEIPGTTASDLDLVDDEVVRRVATEARRTWMSYRVRPDAKDVIGVSVLGDDETARATAVACGETMELPSHVVGPGRSVDFPRGTAGRLFMPLAGVLVGDALGWEVLNLASPRRPPDRSARWRQAVLAAILLLVLAGGSVLTVLNLQKKRLLNEEQMLAESRSEATSRERDAQRDRALLDLISRWEGGNVDWIDHLAEINRELPAADDIVLDQVSGVARITLSFERKRSGSYDPRRWIDDVTVALSIAGRAASREAAELFREQYVKSNRYVVTPVGQDSAAHRQDPYPYQFDLSLVTGLREINEDIAIDVQPEDGSP